MHIQSLFHKLDISNYKTVSNEKDMYYTLTRITDLARNVSDEKIYY